MGKTSSGLSADSSDDIADDSTVTHECLKSTAPSTPSVCAATACPVCLSSDLQPSEPMDALTCTQCATQYPVFRCGDTHIPWLFTEPEQARLEWKARYNGFLHSNSTELERLRRARDQPGNSKTGQRRISNLLHAREQQRNQVAEILTPLGLEGINWPADAADLLHYKLPRSQGLSSYTSNIFRDWAWDNGENEAQMAAVDSILSEQLKTNIGSVLTIGAGACRLPYDMHRRYSPRLSVAVDFNPLLLHIAGRVIQGERIPLFEFPVAPLNEAAFAVLQDCHAPVPLEDGNFEFVLADAMNLPFASDSFDTVVTPWLIDIIPQNLSALIPRINRCLRRGGVWINTGSLAFFHKDECWRYSEEEVIELVEDNGFDIIAVERREIPYLQSPLSAHGRTEKILSFAARKTSAIEAQPSAPCLPGWILDASRPVPASTESGVSASNHLLQAQVLAAIDGKRTINQIGRLVARQYGLGKKETIHAVRRILIDAWDEIDSSHRGLDL